MQTVKRNILLTPGPATTTDSVKYAQVVPDVCPREKEFGRLMESIAEDLTRLVAEPEHYATVLFGGSGTAAVESILSSVVGSNAVIIINNGAYGKRMCEIANAYSLNFYEFKSSPQAPIDADELERFITTFDSKTTHLAVVHHETTTGLLNDIASIGEICKRHQIDLIVDAISSFAAIPIRMKEMNISYLAASSNKNLQGLPGISFVIADKRKLESLRNQPSANYYLNLYAQYKYFSDTSQIRFTPPVQTFYALEQAIAELKLEGLEERYARYTASWQTLIHGIQQLGLKHIVPMEHHSKLVTSVLEPDCSGYDFHAMHDYLYERGFTIYPGKLEELPTFRIANIGDITFKDMEAFLAVLKAYLGSINFVARGE
ncbi:2-aminoethylphosphonate aminotransferase [Alicyclobacillus dauci]|uniref:2-aminoethylphosphonate--pyruvate transaminase n=1 Tax=Alicyclobacillus dauci TaxID=1475485 RepID=A0ABY6Z2B7_9BACL|nr:2-aminoethylphosphonate--pyruvate transaminase [Alicyclobacillus dauci]WAH36748.1 2-aminoethylphosphonate--pyruvate transaminase [Alicyclobacillus dauci]